MTLISWSDILARAPRLQEPLLAWAQLFGVPPEALLYQLEDGDHVRVLFTSRTFPVAVQTLGGQLLAWTWLKVKSGQPERVTYSLRVMQDPFEVGFGGYVHCPTGLTRDAAEPRAMVVVIRALLALRGQSYPVDCWPLVEVESTPAAPVEADSGSQNAEPSLDQHGLDDDLEHPSSRVSELLLDEDLHQAAPSGASEEEDPSKVDRSATTTVPQHPDPHAPTPPLVRPERDTPPEVMEPLPLPSAPVALANFPAPSLSSARGGSSVTRPGVLAGRPALSAAALLHHRDLDRALQRAGLFPAAAGPRTAVNLVRLITQRRTMVVHIVMQQLGWPSVDDYSEEGRIVQKRVTAVLQRLVAAQGPLLGDSGNDRVVREYLANGVSSLFPHATPSLAG